MNNYYQASQSLINTNLARYPVLAVGLPLIGGFLTAVPSHRHIKGYYETLRKPDWAPPSSVFGPAWTALYVSVGYASHLVALRTGPNTLPSTRDFAKTGLGIYGINMLLNFAWSPLMFWKQKIGAALVTAGGLTVSADLSLLNLLSSSSPPSINATSYRTDIGIHLLPKESAQSNGTKMDKKEAV